MQRLPSAKENIFRKLQVTVALDQRLVPMHDVVEMALSCEYNSISNDDLTKLAREVQKNVVFKLEDVKKMQPKRKKNKYVFKRLHTPDVIKHGALAKVKSPRGEIRYHGGMISALRYLRALNAGLTENKDFALSGAQLTKAEIHLRARCKELKVVRRGWNSQRWTRLGSGAGSQAQRTFRHRHAEERIH